MKKIYIETYGNHADIRAILVSLVHGKVLVVFQPRIYWNYLLHLAFVFFVGIVLLVKVIPGLWSDMTGGVGNECTVYIPLGFLPREGNV